MNVWTPVTNLPLFAFACLTVLAAGVSEAAPLKPGDPFPRLEQFQLEGRLPETQGSRVVLVDVWASWCGPCRQSFTALNELHERYAAKGLVIIAVNVDEKQANMARFLAKNRADFTVVRDATQKLVATLAVQTLPSSFLVDGEGKIRHVHRGYRDDETPKAYEREIAVLLGSAESKP
jgi:thiol-disulfide isomerase/thioredoxin